MIARHWKGLAKATSADAYISHLQNDTFPKLNTIPGFISASILQQESNEGTWFLIITEWESMEAIRQFAGDDPGLAVVPPLVQQLMIRYDQRVEHYRVTHSIK